MKRKQGSKCFFFLKKKPVFMINIHNFPQFVNHTGEIVRNKNNNERIYLEMRGKQQVFEKKFFFFFQTNYS